MAKKEQGHHHLRGDGRDPHAVDVAASAGDAGGDHRAGGGGGRGRRCDPSSSCPRSRSPASPIRRRRRSRRFLPRIKQATGAAINITTGGSPFMRVEERVKPAAEFKPEVASLNMGSINFALYGMLDRYKDFKHDWEKPTLEGDARSRLPQQLQGHRVHPRDLLRQRHALRVRVLRHRAPLQPQALPRPRPGEAAALRAVGVRHPRRHRHASRKTSCT